MKIALLTVFALLLSGCTTVEWSDRKYLGASDWDQAEIEVSSRISSDRKEATYTIINKSDRDVFCNSITFRQIIDHPDSYLEIGEDVSILRNVFIRPNQTITDRLASPGETIRGPWHIRAVHSYQGFERCRLADLRHYCRAAEKTDEENAFMAAVLDQSRLESCGDLHEFLSAGAAFDLRRVENPQLRPLIYVTRTLQIILPESPAARVYAATVVLNSRSLYSPQFLFESKHCGEIKSFFAKLDPECRIPVINK